MATYTIKITLTTDGPLEQPEHVRNEIAWAIESHYKEEGLSHECDPAIVTDFHVGDLED